MCAVVSRTAAALSTVALFFSITSTASAQYYDPCNVCGPPVAVLQPVTETVYREVPVTKYRQVQRTVQRPVVRTVNEQRKITAYRQVFDTRVAEVPTVNYQNVTECRQVTQNRSYWQTAWQPIPKVTPLQYDPNPTLAGAMNRMGYSMRMAFTPNYVPQRQFVPNVTVQNVPVTRTVAVPGTRQVTYNVARMEPYETTQTVAVQRVEYVDQPVTAYEPYTETQTVAVGTTTRYAFVDPNGGGTATASGPTPVRSAQEDERVLQRSGDAGENGDSRSSSSDTEGIFSPLSYPQPRSEPTPVPTYLETRAAGADDAAPVASFRPSSAPTAVRVAGWRPSRDAAEAGPELSIAAN